MEIKMQKNVLLMILDGWGIGDKKDDDLIYKGNTNYFKNLLATRPNSQLIACGEDVGLPDGQMGNSEVGHLNIGAGRIVYQDLVKINIEIREKKIQNNLVLIQAMNYAKTNNKAVHFIGLVSDGGVHSLHTHLYALCDITQQYNLPNVFIHALLDGRDTDPHSGKQFITELQNYIANSTAKIASICGRYYTMDRDKRWERVKRGYDLLVSGIGNKEIDPIQAVINSYNNNISDEFFEPTAIVHKSGNPIATIQPDDVVICFNFRTDRLREITTALTQKDFPEYEMKIIPLNYYTMTIYDDSFKNINVIYKKDNVEKTIGQIVSENSFTQLRIAETEKYAHVTFFLSGGREEPFPFEERILIPSPKVATYDLQPEMSAILVKNSLINELNKKKFNFIALNFANGDMVGHTGIKDAILKAVEVIDSCVKEVIETALSNDYDIILIADHGNADHAINEDGTPNTAHSLNPVPCIYISNDKRFTRIENGRLADVAPTLLQIMGEEIPNEMTGRCLLS
jgi:2,3-bisphosphoglycerate-independent phosphoglycerate mutase